MSSVNLCESRNDLTTRGLELSCERRTDLPVESGRTAISRQWAGARTGNGDVKEVGRRVGRGQAGFQRSCAHLTGSAESLILTGRPLAV